MRHISCFLSLLFCITSASAKEQSLPDPKETEVWQPQPAIVSAQPVPSDAIVLFDGTSLDQWRAHQGEAKWRLHDGIMTIDTNETGISSKEKFCDMQLHIEWRTPEKDPKKAKQTLGNSGIFIQGRYELQVLDSYENVIYSNGQAGAIYKQTMPLVNASMAPNTWQTYDVIYRAPRFSASGDLLAKAIITVLHNGVLIHHNTEIQGNTVYRGKPSYKAHGCAPIYLQEHGSPVSYRNIWVRKLTLGEQ